MLSPDPTLRGWHLLTKVVGFASLGIFAFASVRLYRGLGRPRDWLVITVGAFLYLVSSGIDLLGEFLRLPSLAHRVEGVLALVGAAVVAVGVVPVLTRVVKAVHVDPLTGLYNRSHFEESVRREWVRSTRLGTPFSVVLIDLDGFKAVNDTHGHQAGDVVLRHISRLISGHIREYDVAARWGGDEIALLLPSSGLEEAGKLVERLRELISEYDHVGTRVGISAGCATFPGDSKTIVGLIRLADGRLYEEKAQKHHA